MKSMMANLVGGGRRCWLGQLTLFVFEMILVSATFSLPAAVCADVIVLAPTDVGGVPGKGFASYTASVIATYPYLQSEQEVIGISYIWYGPDISVISTDQAATITLTEDQPGGYQSFNLCIVTYTIEDESTNPPTQFQMEEGGS